MKAISFRLGLFMATSFVMGAASQAQEYNAFTDQPSNYVSGVFGSGHASQGGSMDGRAFELRLGHDLNGNYITPDGRIRFDVIHDNEGHPANNHRDGFAGQVVFQMPLSNRLRAEVGVGPYLSMNTTTLNGQEIDDHQLGVLATAALLYYLDHEGWNIRVQVNKVYIPGRPNSVAYMAGIGKEFGGSVDADSTSSGDYWVGAGAGITKTNRGGTSSAIGSSVQFKDTVSRNFAWSVSAIEEGDDKVMQDGTGIAAEAWLVEPLNDNWTASAGAGPYVSNNRYDHKTSVNGIISARVERNIGPKKDGVRMYFDFSRIVSSNSKKDRDMGQIGIEKKLK